MSQPNPFPHSSHLIWRYLEWSVLAIAALSVVLTDWFSPQPEGVLLPLTSITVMGLLSWRLPKAALAAKLLYTSLQFGVIGFPAVLGGAIVPLLSIVPVIHSCRMFALPGRLLVLSGALGIFLYRPFFRAASILPLREPPSSITALMGQSCNPVTLQLFSIALLGLVLAMVVLLFNALHVDRRNRQELSAAYAQLATAHAQLRTYALQIEDQAALQERNRIAREIHDSLGHTFTAQSIQLANALIFLTADPPKAKASIAEARRLVKQALGEVRQSVSLLRSNPVEAVSLETGIAQLVANFRASTAIQPICTIAPLRHLNSDFHLALHRVIQEALTNIAKHAAATQVTINLQEQESMLCLCIQDNGKGFLPAQNVSGFGLQGMRERIVALGGQFCLVSQPNQGCTITATLPLLATAGSG